MRGAIVIVFTVLVGLVLVPSTTGLSDNSDGPTFPLEVTTNKHFYFFSEIVEITITNIGEHLLEFYMPPDLLIANLDGEMVVDTTKCLRSAVVIKLYPGASLSREWDQKYFHCGELSYLNGQPAPLGRYNITVGYDYSSYNGEDMSIWDSVWIGTGISDNPLVRGVYIGGESEVTFHMSSMSPTFTLTSTADERTTGEATILGASYTTPEEDTWPAVAMSAVDGDFDEPYEDVHAVVPTPILPGTYRYYVHAWDMFLNYNTNTAFATLTIVDDVSVDESSPQILDVHVDGHSKMTHYLSMLPSQVIVTAVIDDTSTGGRNISGANCTTPMPFSWPGISMEPLDGAFDSPVETVLAYMPTPTDQGTYDYFVTAWDEGYSVNTTAPGATLVVADDLPPRISDVRLGGQPGVEVKPGTKVLLTAEVDDTDTGGSLVDGAEYTIGQGNWPGIEMDAYDGYFDTTQETVSAVVDTTGWGNGPHEICVYGWDAHPNYNMTSSACSTIAIEGMPPETANVLVNGRDHIIIGPGTPVTLTARIDDLNAGASYVGGANFTIGPLNWPGEELFPTDGSFDSPQEDVNLTIDTTGLSDGSYEVFVYGWDVLGNQNISCTNFATITVDATPPLIRDIVTEPDPLLTNVQANITVSVSDANGVSLVALYITKPDGGLINNFSLAFEAESGTYQLRHVFSAAGEYRYTVWASDSFGNMGSRSGTYLVEEPLVSESSEPHGFPWVIPALVLVVATLIIVILIWRRRRRGPNRSV